MTFIEAFDKVKASMKGAKADKGISHLAIQVNLNDPDASGICYIEIKDGKVFVEPYDYYDRDAIIHISSKNFVDIMRGKLDFDKSVQENQLTIEGSYDAAAVLKTFVKKPTAKKTAAKKAADKNPAEKKAPVKEEPKKVESVKKTVPAEKAEPAMKAETVKKTASAKKSVAKKN